MAIVSHLLQRRRPGPFFMYHTVVATPSGVLHAQNLKRGRVTGVAQHPKTHKINGDDKTALS